MLMLNCYYKYGDKVLFTTGAVQKDGELFFAAAECKEADREHRSGEIRIGALKRIGDPCLIPAGQLEGCEMLNSPCLDCIYCTQLRAYAGRDGGEPVPAEVKQLVCGISSGFTEYDDVPVPDCDYRRTTVPECKALPLPEEFDIKAEIRKIAACSGSHTNPDMPCISPNVFMRICSLMEPDAPVFFGSGDSAEDDHAVMHESLLDYLEHPGRDADVLCIRAGDATKDLYAYIMSEQSETPRYALLAPSIGLAAYEDDITLDNSYKYGYSVYAPEEILAILLEEEKKEKPAAE